MRSLTCCEWMACRLLPLTPRGLWTWMTFRCEWLADYYHLHLVRGAPGTETGCEWLADYYHLHPARIDDSIASRCEWLADYYHLHLRNSRMATLPTLWMACRLLPLTPQPFYLFLGYCCEWLTDYDHLHLILQVITTQLCCELLTDYYHLHLQHT